MLDFLELDLVIQSTQEKTNTIIIFGYSATSCNSSHHGTLLHLIQEKCVVLFEVKGSIKDQQRAE
jgi:hypothetical protein